MHADEGAVGTDHGVPALAHGGLDADFDRRIADDGGRSASGCLGEQFEAGHRHNAGGNAARGQKLLGLDGDGDFRAGGKDRDLGFSVGGEIS